MEDKGEDKSPRGQDKKTSEGKQTGKIKPVEDQFKELGVHICVPEKNKDDKEEILVNELI